MGSGAGFPATRWSLVDLAAAPDGSDALAQLCQTYWYPLYAFARRSGQCPTNAEDLTQGFFAKLLEKQWLADARQEKGRLRTFLLTAFRRYMANEWRHDRAASRGGDWTRVPWQHAEGEARYARSRGDVSPAELFDRQWALTMMERAITEIEAEYQKQGDGDRFAQLKSVLILDKGALDYASLAERLQMTQGAVRVAAHRLRKRFRAPIS